MRIIAGQLKGKHLKAPNGLETRPITDRIKENLFNIWQQNIMGVAFLDLFAGSGSVGIEAISRGADLVVMVEKAFSAAKIIEANLKSCHIESKVEVLCLDVFQALEYLEQVGRTFDIVFLDPPFKQPALAEKALTHISGLHLAKEGQVVIRVQSNHKLAERFGDLEKVRMVQYGESTLYFFISKGEVV